MNYWLIKSEPDVYSIENLEQDGATLWDGVRNYQARNFLRLMAIGDRAFFYHSNSKPPGIVGLAAVQTVGVIDPTQFDVDSVYFDPKATREKPRWDTVIFNHLQTFGRLITLEELKHQFTPEELSVVRKGNRLSVMPVDGAIAQKILARVERD